MVSGCRRRRGRGPRSGGRLRRGAVRAQPPCPGRAGPPGARHRAPVPRPGQYPRRHRPPGRAPVPPGRARHRASVRGPLRQLGRRGGRGRHRACRDGATRARQPGLDRPGRAPAPDPSPPAPGHRQLHPPAVRPRGHAVRPGPDRQRQRAAHAPVPPRGGRARPAARVPGGGGRVPRQDLGLAQADLPARVPGAVAQPGSAHLVLAGRGCRRAGAGARQRHPPLDRRQHRRRRLDRAGPQAAVQRGGLLRRTHPGRGRRAAHRPGVAGLAQGRGQSGRLSAGARRDPVGHGPDRSLLRLRARPRGRRLLPPVEGAGRRPGQDLGAAGGA